MHKSRFAQMLEIGEQREARSPSPVLGRPLFTSPERKLPSPNVALPEDIDMSVFSKPIPGRNWKADCAQRDHLLTGYAMGHRAHLISLLRNLVREMFIFKVEADRQEARRRGEGIRVDPRALGWCQNANPIDGWTGVLPTTPVSKRDAKRSALTNENQMMEQTFGHSTYLHGARCALHGVEPTEQKPKPQLKRPEPTTAHKPTNKWMVVVNGKAVPKSALEKREAPKTPIGYAPLMVRAPKAVGRVATVAKPHLFQPTFHSPQQSAKVPIPPPTQKKTPETTNAWKKLPKMYESKKAAHKEETNWASFCGSKKPSAVETPASKPTLNTLWNIISTNPKIMAIQQQPQCAKTYAQAVYEAAPKVQKPPKSVTNVQKAQKTAPELPAIWPASKPDFPVSKLPTQRVTKCPTVSKGVAYMSKSIAVGKTATEDNTTLHNNFSPLAQQLLPAMAQSKPNRITPSKNSAKPKGHRPVKQNRKPKKSPSPILDVPWPSKMVIFDQPLPHRIWPIDLTRRDEFLSLMQKGDKTAVIFLKRLILAMCAHWPLTMDEHLRVATTTKPRLYGGANTQETPRRTSKRLRDPSVNMEATENAASVTSMDRESPTPSKQKLSFDTSEQIQQNQGQVSQEQCTTDDQTDNYEAHEIESFIISSSQRELESQLAIESQSTKTTSKTQARRQSGQFASDKCIFCKKPVDLMAGYGELTCGHKFHWEQPYLNWQALI
uniref:Uncharacterized protein n=1 Tax=Globodera rostochiensis TaxID=31243 RepID=A0A914H554_GLORO